MLPGKKYAPEDVGRILVRRSWWILPPLVVGLLAGFVVFRLMPEKYRSETLIMVVPQRVPDNYVKATITGNVEDRLPTISEQILSRSRLERIINDFDLYKDARAIGVMEDVIQRMRLDVVGPKLEGKESFRVGYVSRDPRVAQRVTQRLASLFIEENLRDRAVLADDTNQFLSSQLEDAKRRLIEHEKKLEEYRKRFAGQLPTQLPGSLQAIQNAQMQLQAMNESSNRARERRLLIERQLADAQTTPAVSLPPAGASPDTPVPQSAAQQLETARARLDLFRQRYTAEHPDIRALERLVKDLEVKAQEEARRPTPTTPDRAMSPGEAARLKRIADLRGDLEVIDHQIAANQTEESRLKQSIATYQADVDAVPTRESELVELTRDYGTLQETYRSLLAKQEESKLAANLERRQIGEQFKILDPASLPEKPYNQMKRLAALGGGCVGGLFLGLVLVGFLEYRDSSFSSEDEIVRLLGLPVLALVPLLITEDERQVKRRRVRVARLSAAFAMLLLGGAVFALLRWRP